MSLRRFFSDQRVSETVFLATGDEWHHLRTVNRARVGDEVEIFDGSGGLYYCRLTKTTPAEGRLEILKSQMAEKPLPRLIMAPSMTKRRNMTFLVEKLTELGADVIRPLICARTDEKYNAAMLPRWERIAVQAMKVNRRLWPSIIEPPVTPAQMAEQFMKEKKGAGVLLHIEGKAGIRADEVLLEPVICAVGPPGDFTPGERKLLLDAGFTEFRINDGVLKTETAAIAAAAILINRMTGLSQ